MSIEDSLKLLNETSVIGYDSETTGLDALSDVLLTVQFGTREWQIVVDCTTIDIDLYKDVLQDKSKLKILHNAKFDIRFLLKKGIIPENIWDTFLTDSVLNNTSDHPWSSLYSLVYKYCQYGLNKSNRQFIGKEGLSSRVITYCAEDVEYLEQVYLAQLEEAKAINCELAIDIENKFVVVLSYLENCGLYLDAEKWKNLYNQSIKKLSESLESLNKWIIKNLPKYIDPQLDLFSTEKKVRINWASSKQVIPVFKELGFNIRIKDKRTKQEKDSIEATVIEKYSKGEEEKNKFVKLYLEYKERDKAVSTYGLEFLKNIHPITGRIHSEFNQLVDTSRMSSNKPNLQNIPSEVEYRSCFTNSSVNTVLINADYSGQETILLVNNCLEPNLINFYKSGRSDMHSYIAKLCFPKELAAVEEADVKKKRPDLRYLAKVAGFTLSYGGNGDTIAKNVGVEKEIGENTYKAYFSAFPTLKKYFDAVGREAVNKGYVLISNKTGRRYWFNFMEEYRELQDKVNQEGFWEEYRQDKSKYRDIVRTYFGYRGEMQRKAQNFPIQGQSAETMKIAMVHLFNWIKEKGYFNLVYIVNVIHDEALLECPVHLAEEVSKKLEECMQKAGQFYCKTVPLKADAVIANVWQH